METNKVSAISEAGPIPSVAAWEKQQKLIRELHNLLTSYGPTWYSEEIDIRLSEALAVPAPQEDRPSSDTFPQH